jgi:hypothetical protein
MKVQCFGSGTKWSEMICSSGRYSDMSICLNDMFKWRYSVLAVAKVEWFTLACHFTHIHLWHIPTWVCNQNPGTLMWVQDLLVMVQNRVVHAEHIHTHAKNALHTEPTTWPDLSVWSTRALEISTKHIGYGHPVIAHKFHNKTSCQWIALNWSTEQTYTPGHT